jgi:methylase of polypeptide subunit release factors
MNKKALKAQLAKAVAPQSEPQVHEALIQLGRELRSRHYNFTAVTPLTHQRVFDRAREDTLIAAFGWNCWFRREDMDALPFELLMRSKQVDSTNGLFRAKIRFASLDELLFMHSAYPTVQNDAVFFGPDTYRFARALRLALNGWRGDSTTRLIDLGCGSGAGGIFAARLLPAGSEIVLSDLSETAIEFSRINAQLNDTPQVKTVVSDAFNNISGEADIIICNPPYLMDEKKRTYRHGGGSHGVSLSLRFAKESLERLRPGGRFIMYTGTPITGSVDPLFKGLHAILPANSSRYAYEELDPDVFSEELERPAYSQADRIALVLLTVDK